MRPARTLWGYVLREVTLFSSLAMAALVPVLVSRNLVQLLDDIVAVELSAADLFVLGRCVAAMLSPYALPIAFVLGVLLAVGRMAADREVTAMRSCGLGLQALLAPVLVLGLAVSALTGYLMLEVEHRAQSEVRARVKQLATRGSMIEPGSFRRLGKRVLFARERVGDELIGVMVSDHSDPQRELLVLAARGRLAVDPERREARLRLQDGHIYLSGPDEPAGAAQRIGFEDFDYQLKLPDTLSRDLSRRRPREMPMSELLAILERARAGDPLSEYRKQNPAEYQLQVHRRIALPFASAIFPLVAVPLGLRVRRNARTWSTLLASALVAGYYALLTFGQFLALDGALPAALAVWAPNLAFAAAGAVLVLASRRPGS